MTQVFIHLLNMSLSAGLLVVAILLLRPLLAKAPKWSICLLWAVVGLRLILPFSQSSALSLLPSAQFIPTDIAQMENPAVHTGIPAINDAVNPVLTETFVLNTTWASLEQIVGVLTIGWMVGIGIMLIYGLISYIQVRRQVSASIPLENGVWCGDDVRSPFLLGLFRPRIYVPSDMEPEQLEYVLRHERAHLKRRDHWWKPLGFLLLSVYWYNPLLWVAYILLCRDIERACDEKVVAGMESGDIKRYAQALVDCATHRRMILVCPVAFGEEALKSRIRSVLRYKKPVLAMVVAGVLASVAVAVCFLTAPVACAHAYESDCVLQEATCQEKGMERRVCSHCHDSYSAVLPLQEHAYDAGTVTREPTCATVGIKTYTCTDCGATKTQQLEKTAHTPGNPYFETAANCTQTGSKQATCAVCQEVYEMQILPINEVHDMRQTSLTAPTCTKAGEVVNTCSRCGKTQTLSQDKLKHVYQEASTSKATCKRDGYIRYVCSLCKAEKTTTIPRDPDAHVWIENFGMNYKGFFCVECGIMKTVYQANDYSPLFGSSSNTTPTKPQFPVIIWDPK